MCVYIYTYHLHFSIDSIAHFCTSESCSQFQKSWNTGFNPAVHSQIYCKTERVFHDKFFQLACARLFRLRRNSSFENEIVLIIYIFDVF